MPIPMTKRKYRVIDGENGREDLHPMESSARTEQGFLRLFYQRWPTAPRGCFYVELSDGQARVYSDLTGRLTAKFTALES